MTFFKVGCVLLILFLAPLLVFEIDDAFAAFPTFVSKNRLTLSGSDPATTTLTIPSISIGTQTDRLLVASVSLDNIKGPSTGTTVSWVSFGPTGTSCSIGGVGYQNFTRVSSATSYLDDHTTNEIWTLTAPTQNQNCNVIVGLSQAHGNLGFLNNTAAVARTVFYSGVHQTSPIQGGFSNTLLAGSTTPNVTVPVTNSSQIILDTMSSATTGTPTNGTNQNRLNSYNSGITNWNTAYSVQNGGLDTSMSWTIGASAPWAISAIIINSCDVGSTCTVTGGLGGSGGSGEPNGSCDGDCTPPTLGLDKNSNRVVTGGFSFNDNPTDAELYFTPYPLITAYVGEENTIALEIYENDGPQNLAHVGIAFGLGLGESFSQSQAIINWDRDYNGTETVSKIDPDNVLENIRVESKEISCSAIGSNCTELIFYHTFRAPLEFNMVGTNMWDHDRNAWQNYFNHGFQVVGDSINPPKTYDGIYKGKIYSLIETGKNSAVDSNGYTWTFDKGIWNRDYVSIKKTDPELVNSYKSWAINHVTGKTLDDVSHSINLDRNLNYFVIQKDYQSLLAEGILEEMCPECFDDSFEEIDDIFYYDLPEESDRITPVLNQTMMYESEKANTTLSQMIKLFYPGKVYD